MKKKILFLFSLLFIFGCQANLEKHSESFLSFDTYIEFTSYTNSESEFDEYYKFTKTSFEKYHKLFDAYNNYSKINNVKTINDNAGKKAVVVDDELFNLIEKSKKMYLDTKQKNNIALAPVILEYKKIMDEYEKNKDIKNPSLSKLNKLNKCTNIDNIVLNYNKKSIYLKKACAKIDVGSIAKGYTSSIIARQLEEKGMKSGIINAGGNVVLIGKKDNKNDYSIGIANPNDPSNYKIIIKESNTNIVTSGDYQRYYIIDGIKYNHIIDSDTLKPANINKSVTIILGDGLMADYLSTECFMLDLKDIDVLSKQFSFEYVVIDKNDKITISEGLKDAVEIK
ncbi:thiamine biosynthesis lipoprotein [Bacilli bacterium PM5-3]|nr:thiamine biosynthesis lipoprotein [Bacilli bacterium PM5-3]